jgi:hypothetical protein
LTTLDLVVPEFGGRKDEALFAMFGLAQASPGNNVVSKYLHDNFASFLNEQLLQRKKPVQMGEQKEGVPDALRRTFLKLNRQLHDKLYAPSRKMSQVSGTTAHPQFDCIHRQGALGLLCTSSAGRCTSPTSGTRLLSSRATRTQNSFPRSMTLTIGMKPGPSGSRKPGCRRWGSYTTRSTHLELSVITMTKPGPSGSQKAGCR